MEKLLQKGDVFRCPTLPARLEYGYRYKRTGEPAVDKKKLEVVSYHSKQSFRWTEKREGGWERKRDTVLDLVASEPERATAEWVVVETEMSGGGTGHGPHDVYPDGHGVTAKRLKEDGTYDPEGETLFFRQSGAFTNEILPEDIEFVRKAKVTTEVKVG